MRTRSTQFLLALLVVIAAALAAPAISAAATFEVNTVDDLNDGFCNSAHCSLREAINAANAAPGHDLISFDIPGPPPHSIHVLAGGLPPVVDPAQIDASTEPDYDGSPVVELVGTLAAGASGLSIFLSGSGSEVRGFAINRFSGGAGVRVGSGAPGSGGGLGSDDNLIAGNYLGTDVTGTLALSNFYGVALEGDSDRNTVGGPGRKTETSSRAIFTRVSWLKGAWPRQSRTTTSSWGTSSEPTLRGHSASPTGTRGSLSKTAPTTPSAGPSPRAGT